VPIDEQFRSAIETLVVQLASGAFDELVRKGQMALHAVEPTAMLIRRGGRSLVPLRIGWWDDNRAVMFPVHEPDEWCAVVPLPTQDGATAALCGWRRSCTSMNAESGPSWSSCSCHGRTRPESAGRRGAAKIQLGTRICRWSERQVALGGHYAPYTRQPGQARRSGPVERALAGLLRPARMVGS